MKGDTWKQEAVNLLRVQYVCGSCDLQWLLWNQIGEMGFFQREVTEQGALEGLKLFRQ